MSLCSHITSSPAWARPLATLACVGVCASGGTLVNGLVADVASAQLGGGALDQELNGARPSREVPGLDRIGVNEHLDDTLPLDLEFQDQDGNDVTLGSLFARDNEDRDKPVLFILAYHSCPTLCSMVQDAAVAGIQGQEWTLGDQYRAITVSIDPKDTPASATAKRDELIAKYAEARGDNAEERASLTAKAESGWTFLVGDDDAIEELTTAIGFRYFYNANQEQYAHPAVIMFATPEGKLARYLYGLAFDPQDVRFALLEASEGRSITTGEHFLLYCYAYDPEANGYSLLAMRVMRIGGALTALALGSFLAVLWIRERRRSPSNALSKDGSSGSSETTDLPSSDPTSDRAPESLGSQVIS